MGTVGPNGPALLTSHYDASVVLKHKHIVDAIKVLSKDLYRHLEHVGTSTTFRDHFRLSKISFIAEGGGKTRVIAIGDFYTQNALKGLHNILMRILRRLETDGT